MPTSSSVGLPTQLIDTIDRHRSRARKSSMRGLFNSLQLVSQISCLALINRRHPAPILITTAS